jgi:transmembrane sensor
MAKDLHIDDGKLSGIEKKILQTVDSYDVPYTLTTEEALLKLKARIASMPVLETKPMLRKKNVFLWIGSAAASVILIVGAWMYFSYFAQTKIVAGYGQQLSCQLPDSSEVTLNAGSQIQFSKRSFLRNRHLKMDGEVFFKIKKGSRFTINTKNAEIQILGTSFNVFDRNHSFKVSCVTGKIQVTHKDSKVVITPGQSAAVDNDKLVTYSEKNISAVATWRSGEFYFENTPLTTIFNEIERQYNVTFVSKGIGNKFFTGSFSNKNLTDALDIICIPMGLTYEIGGNGEIYIREKGN